MAKNNFQYGGWNSYTLQCGHGCLFLELKIDIRECGTIMTGLLLCRSSSMELFTGL